MDRDHAHRRPVPRDLRIRPARRDDLPRLTALRAQRTDSRQDASTWAERNLSRAENPDLDCALFVAESEGPVLAYGVAARFDPPPDAPASCAPAGHYLVGLAVDVAARRRGIATALVRHRLTWIAERSDTAYYFSDDDNAASIALHARFGFEPIRQSLWFPGLQNPDAPMSLYRLSLPAGP